MRKILALILSIVLIFSFVIGASDVSAKDDSSLTIDAKELKLLEVLGVVSGINENDSALSKNVTRAEAAMYFCRMLNIEVSTPQSFESIFYDVTSEHPYYSYIKTVYDAGYMQGDGNGYFRPDMTISVKEAARVVTDIVGYKGYTAVKGLDFVINKTEVLEGIKNSDAVTLGELLRMFHNILHTPACQMTTFGDQITFEVNDDYLGIEHLFKVRPGEGVVDRAGQVSLDFNQSELRDNMISIDGNVFKYTQDAKELLGYSVDFYYKLGADSDEIIYIEKTEENTEKTISFENIESYSDYVYKYWEGEKLKTIKLSPETNVMFNGVVCIAPETEDFVPKFGKVTLLDNDGDRTYEVAFIESSEFYVVKAVDLNNEKIYDVTDGVILSYKDADSITVTYEGNPYSLDRIRGGNLLKVSRSKADSGYDSISIEVIKDAKNGAAISKTSGDSITVLGEEFELWDYLDETSKSYIQMGNLASIYTCGGYVVKVEKYTVSNYAYLLSAAQEDAPFGDGDVRFMLIFNNGEIATLNMGKSLKVDGSVHKSTDFDNIWNRLKQSATLSAGASSTYPVAQPIKYAMDDAGRLTSIDTFYFDADKEDAEDSLRRLETGSYYYSRGSYALYKNVGGVKEIVAVYSSPAVIVPSNDRLEDVFYKTNLLQDNSSYGTLDVCNVDPETKIAEQIYTYEMVASTASGIPFVVMEKIVEADGDGGVTHKLVLASLGSTVTYKCLDEVLGAFEGLDVGDVISINITNKQEIYALSKRFSLGSTPSLESRVVIIQAEKNSAKTPPYADGYRLVYGTPLSSNGGNMLITPSIVSDLGGIDTTYHVDNILPGSAHVWKYSVVRGMAKVEKASLSDIVPYSLDKENPTNILVDIRGNSVAQIFICSK